MKIFTNKFFLIILLVIFLLFSLQFYFISASYKRDVNSYVTLTIWAWTHTSNWEKKVLKLQNKNQINNGDIISTVWKDSFAIIEWWDKSITRLAWNSKVIIKENFIADDLSKINISFELLRWRTWSNVITIMWKDSYFKETLKDVVAWVRWTIFIADYENEYLSAKDHIVSVENSSWEQKNIYPWETFSIKSFKIEDLKKFIDKNFVKLNESLDKEYVEKLRQEFLNNLESNNPFKSIHNFFRKFFDSNYKVLNMTISWKSQEEIEKYLSTLPEEDRKKSLDDLNTLNQILNFENWKNEILYKLKLNTRKLLIENSKDEELNKTLVKYSTYDLWNIIWDDNINKKILQDTLSFLGENKKYIDLTENSLKWLWDNFNIIKELLINGDFNFSLDELKSKFLELESKWQDFIHKGLNKLLELNK